MGVDWIYCIVENSFIVRWEKKHYRAERLLRDGTWELYTDFSDITYNSRQLGGEAEALAKARKLFALFPELR